MSVIKCPDCGKIVSTRFPIHDCTIPIEYPKPSQSILTDEARDLILCPTRSVTCHIGDCKKCGYNLNPNREMTER